MAKTNHRKKLRRNKKKQSPPIARKWAWIITVCVAAALLIFLLVRSKKPHHVFKTYTGFGIPIPADFIIHGIDVSRYQGLINWEMVKEMNIDSIQIGFAFIKATEGLESKDPQFAENWREARRVGIPRGAYHFFLPDRDGTLQAKNFISQVPELLPGDLPPVVDIEKLNGTLPAIMRKELLEFITLTKAHYGVKPIIYTFSSFYKDYLQDVFPDNPLWIAHYKLQNKRPALNRDWQFWQHSETARVSGINVPVDMNVFYGDSLLFSELLLD